MLSPQSPSPPLSWPELAGRWQELGLEWARFWIGVPDPLHAFSPASTAIPSNGAANPTIALGSAVDPRALAELNARYQPRWAALWAAVQAVLASGGEKHSALPEIAAADAGDRRFAGRAWNELPYFSLLKQAYLLAGRYLADLVALARLPEQEKRRLAFITRQYVDAIAPSNFVATNPEVIEQALATDGESLRRGFANLVADTKKGRISMTDERAFAVGRNLAITPGDVVFRNELIELIQYAPTMAHVHQRPLVIIPPCINKYYILDLTPENSFVRWAVAAGHTVFLVSWRNIPPHLGRLTWDDYLEDGVLTAFEAAKEIAGTTTLNALGFCVGGTLVSSALAVLAARHDRSVASLTLLTTMLDFEDPGEIGVYVSREFLAAREPALQAGQRIDGGELAGAFASLRPNDLVWNYVVNNYLKGETPPAFDLLHWNSDSANLPGPMYVYYLRNMYLENRLVERGALTMLGDRIDLARLRMPAYVYASRDDHIVPWRSAYRTTQLLGGDVTFALGASGHIAGVINPPEKGRRNYWTNPRIASAPDDWFAAAERIPGSWWPHWGTWLARHGGPMKDAPRKTGGKTHRPLCRAPGRYVLEDPDAGEANPAERAELRHERRARATHSARRASRLR